jgi:predicted small integral membrane protein
MRDAPNRDSLISGAREEIRTKAATAQPAASQTASDYLILNGLRIVCLIGACVAPVVGFLAFLGTVNGYHVLVGLLSGVSLVLAAAWIGLAIDIAKHTNQAAGELKELRLLLAGQSDSAAKAESTKT